VNFFGSMNWIGIGAVYRSNEPKVKGSAKVSGDRSAKALLRTIAGA